MKLQFLGANQQVTGSRYLLEAGGLKLMIDCGMFQERSFLERNWENSPIPPRDIDYLLLTHAHLDHSGLIPRLVREGFDRPIITTKPSVDLAEIVMVDAAKIQEEDAAYKRKRHQREKRKGPHPVEPLYGSKDAEDALQLLRGVDYNEEVKLNAQVSARFYDAGHILGSAILELTVREDGGERVVVFSGDLGQQEKVLMYPPTLLERADYVVMESTYGDKLHRDAGSVEDQLCEIVEDTVSRGGNLIIPTFAIERSQELMYHFSRLVYSKRVPHLLVFLDSPMAANVTDVFLKYLDCLDEEMQQVLKSHENPFSFPGLRLVRTIAESKAINQIRGSCIIMAGSGMCTGGRIKHHLANQIDRPESTVLFVGYQAQATLGRQILEGAEEIRIHGKMHRVRARIAQVHGFSAHADRGDLENWLGHFKDKPRKVFLTHGDEEVSTAFGERLRGAGYDVEVPEYKKVWELD